LRRLQIQWWSEIADLLLPRTRSAQRELGFWKGRVSAVSTRTHTAASELPVVSHRRGNSLLITINRPEACNAINQRVAEDLGNALAAADSDPDIRVVVLTGAGRRAFCAGADVKALAAGEPVTSRSHPEWGFAGWVNHAVSTPTIAAVNGLALGGGAELMLACDLAVVAGTAKIGLPQGKRGVIAAGGGAFRLGSQLPQKIAMQMLLTGQPINAETAHSFGLVNMVVPEHLVIQAACALADQIAANAPLAVAASKRVALGIRDGRYLDESAAWELTGQEFDAILASTDAKEGLNAFADKRTAHWQGY
jgi:crotonobetainyl-CoA hydratase